MTNDQYMIKMSNRHRKHHSNIARKRNYKLFRYVAATIVAIILCLSANQAVKAQESPNASQLMANVVIPSPPSRTLTSSQASGNQIIVNGRTLPGAWLQKQGTNGEIKTHLSDGALRQFIGVDLLSSNNAASQPVEWFSSGTQALLLATRLLRGYRYLDITNFARTAGWQLQANGDTLAIAMPQAQITDIRQSQQPATVNNLPFQSARVVLDLNRPAPWQLAQGLPITPPADANTPTLQPPGQPNREWVVAVDGLATPTLSQRYTPTTQPGATTGIVRQLEVINNRTIISLSVPFGMSPQVFTLANPHRLVIDLRPDAMVARDITWAAGLRWRQQFVNLGTERFPVVWLDINPRQPGLTLKPISGNSSSQTGTVPLIQMAQQNLAVAAINAGYFNRNNQLPLGAVRRDGQWLSGPILNRGAVAWNDAGEFYFGRLSLQETLIAPNNQRLPILFLNSAYVQSGIARYTPTWGPSYTPLTDNEIIVVIQKDRVTNQLPGGKANETPITIPQDGYLLTLRANATNTASQLPIGAAVSINSNTNSPEFNRYPHIMGAGPLLVQNNQVVLDAQREQFSQAFITQRAVRSAICTKSNGSLMFAAVHNRAGGLGPTLAEHAELMKQMGCVNALNLDGGSSTSLYLGGQLLDRSPNTAGRVHNAIGIFLQQR